MEEFVVLMLSIWSLSAGLAINLGCKLDGLLIHTNFKKADKEEIL